MRGLIFGAVATAFYIPGNAPNAYDDGAAVPIQVNKMNSAKTQVPYGYYSLDFCGPDKLVTMEENLGQILRGDLIQNTPYEARMKIDETCRLLCIKTFTEESLTAFKGMIDDEYFVNLLADDLPGALVLSDAAGSKTLIGGYPVGLKEVEEDGSSSHLYLINHLNMKILYHPTKEGSRVVGFELEPRSVNHTLDTVGHEDINAIKCDDPTVGRYDLSLARAGDRIAYTYTIEFAYSEVSWATRWDAHLKAAPDTAQIHWFSIVNAFVVVVMLSAVVATILLRTVLRDIARYNNLDDIEEAQEESGWKLLHGDVFRRPRWSKLLAACAGTGVQVFIMIALTLCFAMLGVLSPANRGALLQVMLILFAFMGGPAGYVSARFNKLFLAQDSATANDDATSRRSFVVTLWTAFQYTGVCFTTFLCLNLILWWKKSSGAIPFSYIFLLVLLWLGISVPLVFVGAYMGYRKPSISVPVRTNTIPRQIPPLPLFLRPLVVVSIGGILPFGAVFSELSFILASVWQHRFYYLFGFLTLVMIILMITCAETSIVFTYFQLVAEDHNWCWRSWWVSAFSAVYFLIFGVIYFLDALEITRFASILLYFGYTLLMAYTFFLVTGAIGFISTFIFMRSIYAAVKVD